MQKYSLNYDRIADQYNQRYPTPEPSERGQVLLDLATQVHAGNILEVGCGTGFWLNLLHFRTPRLYGLDYSMGMIQQARKHPAPLKLSRGEAIHLPFRSQSFEFVYCVDAIHHFGDYQAFLEEVFRILKPGGAVAVVGSDPHGKRDSWYIYEYFETVYETDLLRFPRGDEITGALKDAGFQNISHETVEHILNVYSGEDVWSDPFLKQNATSQLALLNDEIYQAGLRKIHQAISEAKLRAEEIIFRSEIFVDAILGYRPAITAGPIIASPG